MRRRVVLGVMLLAVLGGLCTAAAAPQILRAARLGSAARANLQLAETHIHAGRKVDASRSFDSASAQARAASRQLRGFAPAVLSHVPVLGRPIRSAEMLARATADASSVAKAGLDVFPDRSPWSAGTLDLGALNVMGRAARRADTGLRGALRLAREAPGWPIPGSLASARGELIRRLAHEVSTITSTRRVLDILPVLSGSDGPRRYFVVFQNPAELRGTGGFWGNYALLNAQDGRVRLGTFGRLYEDLAAYATVRGPAWYESRYGGFGGSTDFRQLNSAPDFPTVAKIAEADLAKAEGVGPVDGVIAVDPVGLAALLQLTGPVKVPDWPDPIDASNVVRITLHDAYTRFANNNTLRVTFLAEVAQAAFDALLRSDIPVRPDALRGLGNAVQARRMMFHFVRSREQKTMAAQGADGALGESRRMFGLVTQNTAPSKLDYWLERRLGLTVRLQKDGSANVKAQVTLRNGGSGKGEPHYVVGPYDENFTAGWEQQFVSLYMSKRAIDKAGPGDVPVGDEEEPGFKTASTSMDVPPLEERAVTAHFTMPELWDAKRGILRLKIRRQPTLHPDEVRIEIVPPAGGRVERGGGVSLRGGRAVWRGNVDRDVVVTIRLTRDG